MKKTNDYSNLAAHQQPKPDQTPEPERTFDLSLTDEGVKWTPVNVPVHEAIAKETRIDVPTRSPFTPTEIERYRQFPQVREQFARLRPHDVLTHNKYMRARGPEVEKAVGVTAKQLFRDGDSAAAARLKRENPAAYAFLKELAFYL